MNQTHVWIVTDINGMACGECHNPIEESDGVVCPSCKSNVNMRDKRGITEKSLLQIIEEEANAL